MPNQRATDVRINRQPKQRRSAHRRIDVQMRSHLVGSQSIGFAIPRGPGGLGRYVLSQMVDVADGSCGYGLAGARITDLTYSVGGRAANAQRLANTPVHLRVRHHSGFDLPERCGDSARWVESFRERK